MQEIISLLEALRNSYPDCSTTTLRDWIKQGRVSVNGTIIKIPSTEIQPQHKVTLLKSKKSIDDSLLPTCKIVYEDPHLVVVDKKPGCLSVATDFETENTVHNDLKNRYRPHKVFVIHRLDQGTSGIMVFARSQTAYEHLKKQLEQRSMHREYIAIIKGTLAKSNGTWHTRIFEDDNYNVHVTLNPREGEEAITHYSILASRTPYSVLHAKLETGKKNQIRVHCQHAGVPIVGDDRYGGDTSSTKRLLLHAYMLEFVHPVTKKLITLYSPIPRVFPYFVPASKWLNEPMTLEPPYAK